MPEAPDVFIVHDATLDPRFQNNPLVTGPPFIRFYAGAALILDDSKVRCCYHVLFIIINWYLIICNLLFIVNYCLSSTAIFLFIIIIYC